MEGGVVLDYTVTHLAGLHCNYDYHLISSHHSPTLSTLSLRPHNISPDISQLALLLNWGGERGRIPIMFSIEGETTEMTRECDKL